MNCTSNYNNHVA
uniref:Uncharacterized protein n=1 Tax=Rhizophora mucronata TaxID=61149 RepID=A0A2P2Q2U9_RHIMU